MVLLRRLVAQSDGSGLSSHGSDGVRSYGRVLFDVHESAICLVAASSDGLCAGGKFRDELFVVLSAGGLGVEVAHSAIWGDYAI